jgi:hypothetical protein
VLTNAVETSPNARMFDELGLIYLNHYTSMEKRLDEKFLARQCFATAADLAPDDVLIKHHLAAAEIVLAKARAATQASTESSTVPSTQP